MLFVSLNLVLLISRNRLHLLICLWKSSLYQTNIFFVDHFSHRIIKFIEIKGNLLFLIICGYKTYWNRVLNKHKKYLDWYTNVWTRIKKYLLFIERHYFRVWLYIGRFDHHFQILHIRECMFMHLETSYKTIC